MKFNDFIHSWLDDHEVIKLCLLLLLGKGFGYAQSQVGHGRTATYVFMGMAVFVFLLACSRIAWLEYGTYRGNKEDDDA